MKYLLPFLLLLPNVSLAFSQSALLVAGSSQYLSAVDSTSLSVTGNLTMQGWLKFTSLPAAGNNFSLIGKWVDALNQHSYLVQLQNVAGTYKIRFLNSSDGTSVGQATVTLSAPATAAWHYWEFDFTASTNTVEVFLDGVSQGSAIGSLATSIFDSTAEFDVGNDNLSAYTDAGYFNWRVWSSVRGGTDYANNSCLGLGSTSNLQAEWSLSGVLTDNSGNSNILTNNGSATFPGDIPSSCVLVNGFQLWPFSFF